LTDDPELYRTIGGLAAKIEGLERSLKTLKDDMDARFKSSDSRLDEVIKTLHQLGGGWKLILMAGAVLGIVVAVLTAWKLGGGR
jgi:hypothetical protein